MFDLAGRERNQVSLIYEYIMDETLPNARVALRRARNAKLGDDFGKKLTESSIKKEVGSNGL